jgi:hypothetical protein
MINRSYQYRPFLLQAGRSLGMVGLVGTQQLSRGNFQVSVHTPAVLFVHRT